MIDCGEGRACFEPALREALRVLDCSISRVLITHRHFDHTGGLDQVRRVCGESVEVRKLVRDEFKFDPGRYNAVRSVDCGYASSLVDGERIQVDSETTLRAWHTPGHCEDHCCFVLEEERVSDSRARDSSRHRQSIARFFLPKLEEKKNADTNQS